ncbi:hypothetical protein [Capsulimonas corticalis]|uniref:hypothetical protein n=1 Tax=Capsulimonas corticalis TaxID=2219043 RepID=UPI00263520F8|nr:hypothetical protein [Capsulimonas corticalis]
MTDEKPITLSEIVPVVEAHSSDYHMDGDTISFTNEPIGIVEINAPGDGVFEDDIALLKEFAEQKQSKDMLLTELQRAKSMLTIQVVFMLEHDAIFEALDPLLDWLLANRAGLLVDEGGYFQNASGDLE